MDIKFVPVVIGANAVPGRPNQNQPDALGRNRWMAQYRTVSGWNITTILEPCIG
jgi:hypothetical protein